MRRRSDSIEWFALAIFALVPVWACFLAYYVYHQAVDDVASRTAQKIMQPQAKSGRR